MGVWVDVQVKALDTRSTKTYVYIPDCVAETLSSISEVARLWILSCGSQERIDHVRLEKQKHIIYIQHHFTHTAR